MFNRIVPRLVRSIVLPSFSSSSSSSSSYPRDTRHLADILEDEANLQPKIQSYHARDYPVSWKPFNSSAHIRPYDMTYKARLKTRPFPVKRQTVGPPSREARNNDVFYNLSLDPLAECQNPDLLAAFMSEMGKIYGREVTGLTTRNQRRIAKAIRRAKQMAIIPLFSRPNSSDWRSAKRSR